MDKNMKGRKRKAFMSQPVVSDSAESDGAKGHSSGDTV